jgi:Na+-transporting NADH:ubiquinone oxidoreductase subunit NqrB
MDIRATASVYWKRYKALSPWTAMVSYMATLALWGALFVEPHGKRWAILLVVVPLGVIADWVLHRAQTGKPNFESSLITSLIVAVLMPTDIGLGVAALAVLTAIASKHFVLQRQKHIFNPASFGVAVTSLLFGYNLGWWPDSFVWLTVFFGLLNVWRVKKYPQIGSFFVVYLLLATIFVGFPKAGLSASDLGQQTFLLAFPWFFTLFMLPEPVTSLQPRARQIEFGALAAAAGFALSYVGRFDLAAPLWGLLLANLYAFWRQQRRASAPAPTPE